MDLGKKIRKGQKDKEEWPSNDSESIAKQLEENKKREAELLKKLEEEKERERKQKEEEQKQREREEQEEKERQLLEDERKRKEHMEAELAKTKEKEEKLKQEQLEQAFKEKEKQEKEKKIKNMVDTNINTQMKSGHPEGCLCGKCKKMRKRIRTPKSGKSFDIVKIVNMFKSVSKSSPSKDLSQEGAIDVKIQPTLYTDITVLGIRLAIGFSFIAHGLSKMAEDGAGFASMLTTWGVPPELAFPIALAELVAGILITVGILTRISSILIGIIMLGAIFVVKGTNTLIGQGGVELDIIILSIVALLGIFGPGRFSVANIGIKGLIFDRKLH